MREQKSKTLFHIPLIIMCVYALAPLTLLTFNSFKSSVEIRTRPLSLPMQLLWRNYVDAWQIAGYAEGILSSTIILVLSIAILLAVASPMAFALVKLRIPGGNIILLLLLLGMTLPPQLSMVPLFFMWQKMGMVDSPWALAPIYAARYLPFSVFLLRSYYMGIAEEIEDAGRVDGCSEIQVFLRIILPLSKPVVMTIVAVVSMWVWNEFLFALTFLHTEGVRSMAIRYYTFTGRFSINLAYVAASGVMMVLPIMVLYVFLQRSVVEGLTHGSLKG